MTHTSQSIELFDEYDLAAAGTPILSGTTQPRPARDANSRRSRRNMHRFEMASARRAGRRATILRNVWLQTVVDLIRLSVSCYSRWSACRQSLQINITAPLFRNELDSGVAPFTIALTQDGLYGLGES